MLGGHGSTFSMKKLDTVLVLSTFLLIPKPKRHNECGDDYSRNNSDNFAGQKLNLRVPIV